MTQHSGTRSREYVRKLPRLTQEQIIAQARRQAAQEAANDAAGEYELEEDEGYYPTRLPTSSRRYQQLPDVLTKQGNVHVVSHYHDQPLRAHRHTRRQNIRGAQRVPRKAGRK